MLAQINTNCNLLIHISREISLQWITQKDSFGRILCHVNMSTKGTLLVLFFISESTKEFSPVFGSHFFNGTKFQISTIKSHVECRLVVPWSTNVVWGVAKHGLKPPGDGLVFIPIDSFYATSNRGLYWTVSCQVGKDILIGLMNNGGCYGSILGARLLWRCHQ